MNIKHLATKGFTTDVVIKRSIVYEDAPLAVQLKDDNERKKEEIVVFDKPIGGVSVDEVDTKAPNFKKVQEQLKESPIGDIIYDNQGVAFPLSAIFDYRVGSQDSLSEYIPVGSPFDIIFNDENVQGLLRGSAKKMFPEVNPNTQEDDIDEDSFYTPYIPLAVITNCIPSQRLDGKVYFNPNGTLSIAEFLDGLNSIKYYANANNTRHKSLDNISTEADYFNEGYQSCLRGISSPLFNLYTRKELLEPITRMELAYITVLCWNRYLEKYNSVYGGNYYLGISFDWGSPLEVLSKYTDGFDYKVSKVCLDDEYDVISLNIKDYSSDRSMSEYKEDLKKGVSPIPMPVFMSMLELGVVDFFHYEDDELNPMKEVTRGEWAYFLTKLSCAFPTKYVK